MIRKIRENDIAACLGWYNYYIRESTATFETEELSLEAFRDRVMQVTQKYPWLVLEEEGQLVGYVYLSQFMPRSAYDWSADISLYLDPAKRGHGYGKQLMEAIIHTAEAEGYRNLISVVTSENTASVHLHGSFGFTRAGEYRNFGYKFGRWLSVTVFTLALNAEKEDISTPFSDKWKVTE